MQDPYDHKLCHNLDPYLSKEKSYNLRNKDLGGEVLAIWKLLNLTNPPGAINAIFLARLNVMNCTNLWLFYNLQQQHNGYSFWNELRLDYSKRLGCYYQFQ